MQMEYRNDSEILDVVGDDVLACINRDTVEARGLPNQAFTDPQFLDLERKYVFSRTWVFAGLLSDIPDTGDVKPVTVGGRELIMVRSKDGAVNVFHNVCPHRGAQLVVQASKGLHAMTCPYHAWSFDLSGSLRGRPHFDGPGKHDKAESEAAKSVCLFGVRSATWNDWVFVNLDGQAPAFEDYMEPIFARFQSWNLHAFQVSHYQSFEFHCNWKLAIENFCDNYHVFKVHPGLHDMQAASDRFGMEPDGAHMFNWFTIDGEGRGLTVDPEGPVLPDVPGLPNELKKNSPFCNIFPNVTMAVFPSNFQFFMFEPLSVDETIMHVWFYFVGDAVQAEKHAEARAKVVSEWSNLNSEDAGICHRLQEGRSCDAYDGGRFSPYWDVGTLHFHKQIVESIRGLGGYAR